MTQLAAHVGILFLALLLLLCNAADAIRFAHTTPPPDTHLATQFADFAQVYYALAAGIAILQNAIDVKTYVLTRTDAFAAHGDKRLEEVFATGLLARNGIIFVLVLLAGHILYVATPEVYRMPVAAALVLAAIIYARRLFFMAPPRQNGYGARVTAYTVQRDMLVSNTLLLVFGLLTVKLLMRVQASFTVFQNAIVATVLGATLVVLVPGLPPLAPLHFLSELGALLILVTSLVIAKM